MFSWVQLGHLAGWCGAKCSADFPKTAPVSSISTDSRTIRQGEVFVALSGESFDGHDHVESAVEKGAIAVIVNRQFDLKVPQMVVPDTLKAFATIGGSLRDRFVGKVVAITGSAGKSSTKEMVASILGEDVTKSPASFNNLLGVSKTLCLVEDSTKYLVLEMGMNALGEIRELCDYFKPQFGAITNIGDAHVGKLGGVSKVMEAKKELFDYLAKSQASGIALNKSDARVMEAYCLAFPEGINKLTYSATDAESESLDVCVRKKNLDPKSGFLSLTIDLGGKSFDKKLPLYGLHHAENIVAAISLALLLGIDRAEIPARLENLRPTSHRGELIELDRGCLLIDESYNSNPSALRSSLESLSHLDRDRRKVLVLGDMLELGKFEEKLHRQVAEDVISLFEGHRVLFLGVGKRMSVATKILKERGQGIEAESASGYEDARPILDRLVSPGDVILIKSSRGGQLDRLVASLNSVSQ